MTRTSTVGAWDLSGDALGKIALLDAGVITVTYEGLSDWAGGTVGHFCSHVGSTWVIMSR